MKGLLMFYKNVISLEEAIEQEKLPEIETFDAPFDSEKTKSGVIRIVFPEFTCLCPKTGYPDFANIKLYYLPDKKCLELKAWKLYLNSFRMVGTFHETVTHHLFNRLKELLDPKWMMIIGDYLPRGNVDTTVVFETDTLRPKGADVLIGNIDPYCGTMI